MTTTPVRPASSSTATGSPVRPGSPELRALLDRISVDADLRGLGPFLLQVGSEEALRPDSELLAERLAAAGVPVRLQIFDRAVHVFQAFAFSNPDARRAVGEVAEFVKAVA